MASIRRLALALLALVLTVSGAANTRAIEVGDIVRGHVVIGDKQVPLPRGDWLVAGLGVQEFDLAAIGAFGAIRSAILFLRDGGRVVAVAEINTNEISVNDGWGRAGACQRGQQFLLVTRYRTGWDMSCLFIQPTAAPIGAAGPPAWDAARRLAAASRLTLPELWLSAGFRVSDRQDIVDLRLHFDPALLLGASAPALASAADWSTAAVRDDPRRLAAVQLLSTWAVGFDGAIELGMRNQLGVVLDMPQVAPFLSDEPQVDAKLAALERLYREGLLTRAEFRSQSRMALRETPMVVEQTGGLPLSVQKNISFRVFGSSVDYILAYVVTLSSPLSSAITASIVAIHSVIFVLNDNYWEDYWARRTTRDANRVVDFAYIGQPG